MARKKSGERNALAVGGPSDFREAATAVPEKGAQTARAERPPAYVSAQLYFRRAGARRPRSHRPPVGRPCGPGDSQARHAYPRFPGGHAAPRSRPKPTAAVEEKRAMVCCWERIGNQHNFSTNPGGEKMPKAQNESRQSVTTTAIVKSGWAGIRTLVRITPEAVFKTAALDRSATHPLFCVRRTRGLGQL